MKLMPPRIPLQLSESSLELLGEGQAEATRFYAVDGTKGNFPATDFNEVIIEKATFLQAHFVRVGAKDVRVIQTDFSSAVLTDGNINRGEFINCRMTGIDMNKTNLHDVVFKGCKLDLANFRFTDLRRVRFVDCTLVETDFLGATLYDVTFETSVLEKTVFDQAHCKQVDLRGSQLTELSGWGSMKGVVIDDLQVATMAPYFAGELA